MIVVHMHSSFLVLAFPSNLRSSPITMLLIFSLLPLVLLPPVATPMSFNFTTFNGTESDICLQEANLLCFVGSALVDSNGVVQLTEADTTLQIPYSTGYALYALPLRLWENSTGELAHFTTDFVFSIEPRPRDGIYGHGMAFFLAPYPAQMPSYSAGGALGIVNGHHLFNDWGYNSFVAVEFDSFYNENWDPSAFHMGINVNSIKSETYVNLSQGGYGGSVSGHARITYNAASQTLSALLLYNGSSYTVSHVVDLRDVLPGTVSIGITGETEKVTELNSIHSWSFQSTNIVEKRNHHINATDASMLSPAQSPIVAPEGINKRKSRVWLVLGVLLCLGLLTVGIGLAQDNDTSIDQDADDASIDEEFQGRNGGPRRFRYMELAAATENFKEERRLGKGGFGAVYMGRLSDFEQDVAIKKVSKNSRQGKKEYISEVKIISRLRHRNLVQLIGWCHEHGDLLLVYELMPNGSLDSHLFRGDKVLPWLERYNIAFALASALLYLHEEWEQCVVHRDVKSSNIMLDSSFNAKLGDFGLARLVDHGSGLQTTLLAGTVGYMAPECFITGKCCKESDVYSFGIVALEIATGRRPVIDDQAIEGKLRLVEWVWDLYGKGKIVEAADKRLDMAFDERQLERLMVTGLWCAHPDLNYRPSIKQAMSALNFEVDVPELPSQMPVILIAPAMLVDTLLQSNGVSAITTLAGR